MYHKRVIVYNIRLCVSLWRDYVGREEVIFQTVKIDE